MVTPELTGKLLSRVTGIVITLTLCLSSAAGAQTGAAASIPEESLNKLENKMFSRNYGHDPLEKRVERLELMIFGGVQVGGLNERWQRINSVLADREKEHSQKSPLAQNKSPVPGPGRYPALDSIEWRILKKSHKDEAIGERLSRLETKLLGQPNTLLSYADRLERLKKMVKAGEIAKTPSTSLHPQLPQGLPLGPMPRALPRMTPDGFGSPFASPFSVEPFGGPDDMSSMNKMLSEMFDQMNRQMRDLRNMPPGSYSFKFGPNVMPGLPRRNGIPDIFSDPNAPSLKRPPSADLPPYADPNSI